MVLKQKYYLGWSDFADASFFGDGSDLVDKSQRVRKILPTRLKHRAFRRRDELRIYRHICFLFLQIKTHCSFVIPKMYKWFGLVPFYCSSFIHFVMLLCVYPTRILQHDYFIPHIPWVWFNKQIRSNIFQDLKQTTIIFLYCWPTMQLQFIGLLLLIVRM